ncbi:peptidase, S24 family, UV repair protein [unidentified eubacterium SCB49]|nr:peptidase, S24 family, UV repair protein [unidentified eubacterium SCB49]
MKLSKVGKLSRKQHRHTAGVSVQTGFPSPATHYLEPTIDLHQELITNADATFFVRVSSNEYAHLKIYNEAVLIIDRSTPALKGKLALVIIDGEFSIIKVPVSQGGSEAHKTFTLWGVINYVINKAI